MLGKGVFDRNLKAKPDENISTFSFLFSEMANYCRQMDAQNAEQNLADIGYTLGQRYLELAIFRDKNMKKETSILGMLRMIHGTIWKQLFGKQADELEQIVDSDDEFTISDKDTITGRFICFPKNESGIYCDAFIAGIIEGILNAAEFPARVVTQMNNPDEERKTTFVITFSPEAIERDRMNK